jgi:hypothetical protein
MLGGMDLAGMDVAAAQAASPTAPWLVLGGVLAVVLLALVGLVAVLVLGRPARRTPDPLPDEPPAAADDLPDFLEHPPGSPGAPSAAAAGWPVLTGVAVPPRPAPPPPAGPERRRRPAVVALAAMAVTTLLLVGVAVALAVAAQPAGTGAESSPAADPTPTPDVDGLEARLTFGGIVLERRAVGVTATYPQVTVTSDGGEAVAHVVLPTFNCLTDRAPADPVAAGCVVSLTEYADLAAPELTVTRDGDGARISGRFPTYLRPNGAPAEGTGHAYDLAVSVAPRSGDPDEGPVPAAGGLELGADRTRTTGEDDELRFGS